MSHPPWEIQSSGENNGLTIKGVSLYFWFARWLAVWPWANCFHLSVLLLPLQLPACLFHLDDQLPQARNASCLYSSLGFVGGLGVSSPVTIVIHISFTTYLWYTDLRSLFFTKGMDIPGPCVNNVQDGAVTTRLFCFWCVRSITSPGFTQVLFLLCDTGVTHTGEWHDLCSYGWPRSDMCSGSTWSVNQPALCVCQVSSCSGLQPCSRFRNSWVPVSLAGLSALPFGVWNSQRPCTLLEVQIYVR